MKKLVLIIFIFFVSLNINAQYENVDFNKFVLEMQKMSTDPNSLDMIFWIPNEFWKISFASDNSLSKSEMEEWIRMVEDYTILMVSGGEIGTFGQMNYISKEDLKNNITITDKYFTKYYPLKESQIKDDTEMMLDIIEMFMGNSFGEYGENLHCILFEAKNNKGDRIADPTESGIFYVNLFDEQYNFRCPFGSLVPNKTCSEDGEELNGSWDYCPWHGNKLSR